MLLRDLISSGVKSLSAGYPGREAREMVFSFLEDSIGVKRYTHILEPAYEVPESMAAEVLEGFERMSAGEPVQYVAGYAYFYGRRFRVTPDVLIPRQETELLCRTVLERKRGVARVLDLCTGSGCIAWTLALERPGSEVTAIDISQCALEVAASQDFSLEMMKTGALIPEFMQADILTCSPDSFCHSGRNDDTSGCRYDVIVSNPPYVMEKEKALMRPNVLEHEPHLALFVDDEDPLVFYRAVAGWSSMLLSSDGFGIVEINEAFGQETVEVFRNAGFASAEVLKDLSSKDRFVMFSR